MCSLTFLYLSVCTCPDYWVAQSLWELYSGLFGFSCFVLFPWCCLWIPVSFSVFISSLKIFSMVAFCKFSCSRADHSWNTWIWSYSCDQSAHYVSVFKNSWFFCFFTYSWPFLFDHACFHSVESVHVLHHSLLLITISGKNLTFDFLSPAFFDFS